MSTIICCVIAIILFCAAIPLKRYSPGGEHPIASLIEGIVTRLLPFIFVTTALVLVGYSALSFDMVLFDKKLYFKILVIVMLGIGGVACYLVQKNKKRRYDFVLRPSCFYAAAAVLVLF